MRPEKKAPIGEFVLDASEHRGVERLVLQRAELLPQRKAQRQAEQYKQAGPESGRGGHDEAEGKRQRVMILKTA